MIKTVWGIALSSLAVWSLLAWGMTALLSGIAWSELIGLSLPWMESLGLAAIAVFWSFGTIGLLSSAIVSTLMLRIAQGRSLPRVFSPMRGTLPIATRV